MKRMQDKVTIITGAGTGVGRACMELFAREGAKVIGVSRTQSNLDETLALARNAGGDSMVVAVDISEDSGAEKVVAAALAKYGRIDCLVNSAGVGYSWMDKSPGTMNDVVNTTPEAWREVMRLNLDSTFLMCRRVIPELRNSGGGTIVNVASISGYQGLPVAHTYTAAKGGMINLTRSLCVSYAKDNIRSNCIAPGFIVTPMVAAVLHYFDDPKVAESLTPMSRAGTPMEMAFGCLYLACDESTYCNGTVLTIDGGTTARQ